MNNTVKKLGFCSAILSAVFTIIWFITFNMKDVLAVFPEWQNIEAYSEAFTIMRHIYIYPSLLLAITYIIMLSCIHLYAPEDKKVWSIVALSIGIIYAVMASINYNILAVAVRQSLSAGETAGIEMFIPDNPHSIFNALANSYVYMAISMFFAAFIFQGSRLASWIRIIFLLQIISAVGQIGQSMFGWSMSIFIATSMVWVIGSPIAFILIAILFRKDTGHGSLYHDTTISKIIKKVENEEGN